MSAVYRRHHATTTCFMRSKASFKGHPLHPALIPFPFAFLFGAAAFDVAGRVSGNAMLSATGAHLSLAGIAMALVAAVPGFIDYFYTVPPESSGKKRATKHMLTNLTVVALFAIAWVLRGDASTVPGTAQLVLEVLGAGLLVAGGWMGGTLVNRNQIGVDHRYADAGKWREGAFRTSGGKPTVVARSDELAIDQMKLVRINGRRVVLGRTDAGFRAFDDRCTHRGASLADGVLMCGKVQCPWHGSQFDTGSGAVSAGPAKKPIATYRVEERDGDVMLWLNDR
jgi:nitrite reductase/ring-hydroxylating ferredoxin subunit/uncharacterized membrane protein